MVFLLISTDFTPPPRIPVSSNVLYPRGFTCLSEVEPQAWTSDLQDRRRTLYAQ